MHRVCKQTSGRLICFVHLFMMVLVCTSLSPAFAKKTRSVPLDGAQISAMYQQVIQLYGTGEKFEAYRLVRRHLDLDLYPAELLTITIKLAYEFGDYALAMLTSAQFERLFRTHPDRQVISAISAYYQGRCKDIDTDTQSYKPTRANRQRQQTIRYYKALCKEQSWQHYLRYDIKTERAVLAGEASRLRAVKYHPRSYLSYICQLFTSPSCLNNGHVLLPANSKPRQIIHSDINYQLQKSLARRSVVGVGISNRFSMSKSRIFQAVESAGSFLASRQFSDSLTAELYTEFRNITIRPLASQQYDFIQAQAAISIENNFSMFRYAPRYRAVLSHSHLYGDIAPYHEFSVAHEFELSLTPKLQLHLERKNSYLDASKMIVHGDMNSVSYRVHIRYFPHPAGLFVSLPSSIDLTETSLEFQQAHHTSTRTALWLASPYRQRQQNLELKIIFEHIYSGVNLYTGVDLARSKSENSLLNSSYDTVIFGLTKRFMIDKPFSVN